jgi:hypothetical protein
MTIGWKCPEREGPEEMFDCLVRWRVPGAGMVTGKESRAENRGEKEGGKGIETEMEGESGRKSGKDGERESTKRVEEEMMIMMTSETSTKYRIAPYQYRSQTQGKGVAPGTWQSRRVPRTIYLSWGGLRSWVQCPACSLLKPNRCRVTICWCLNLSEPVR